MERGTNTNIGKDVTVNANGDLLITGSFTGDATFGSTTPHFYAGHSELLNARHVPCQIQLSRNASVDQTSGRRTTPAHQTQLNSTATETSSFTVQ